MADTDPPPGVIASARLESSSKPEGSDRVQAATGTSMKSASPGMQYQVSVIIPCFRCDDFLPTQLDALAHQEDAPPFEVLLCDNGGNRDLAGLVERWRYVLPGLRIVDATARRGTAYARNRGMGEARAPKLLFADADDLVMPHWIARGSRQLDKAPAFSGGAISVTAELMEQGRSAVLDYVLPRVEPDDYEPLLSGSQDYPLLMGCSSGMTAQFAQAIGGYDVAFASQAEDNDLAFRIRNAGVPVLDASQVCIAYRQRKSSEKTFRQGMRAGLAHALLCARHNAWQSSPAYRGHWVLRPLKYVLETAQSRSRWDADSFGRQIGTAIGRLGFAMGRSIPAPELGVGMVRDSVPHDSVSRDCPSDSEESLTVDDAAPSEPVAGSDEVTVSVVIPCKNGAEVIGRQFDAIRASEDAPPFEVILVVNGSTDGTWNVAEEYRRQHPDFPLRIIGSAPGRAGARNTGALAARGKILAFCDADDQVFPRWLVELTNMVQQHHGIVGGQMMHTVVNSPKVLRAYGIDPNEPDRSLAPDPPLDDGSELRDVGEGNFAVWKDDYLAVGGMDESYEGGLEGTDYCVRSHLARIPINYCQRALIHYWLRNNPLGSFRQQRALARCKILFFVRFYKSGLSSGASLKWTVKGFIKSVLALLRWKSLSADKRFALMHDLGGHIGSLEGHVLYRFLRRIPKRKLIQR
ncbi:glycosyltransferase [Devriesea agamarum]|uniref:glycosyltransferase n=1 Tax=Devriesea agamarum TaxID=472569 RepID=UPI00071DA6EE|nr:glycosyltransferase [Devriesea agamarum]